MASRSRGRSGFPAWRAAALSQAHILHYYICNIKQGRLPLTRRQGRPPSPTEGAREAVDAIRSIQQRLALTEKALADRAGIDQSSVSRALNREPPAWTPSLQKIWHYAKNEQEKA